jgi:hypothetical protein
MSSSHNKGKWGSRFIGAVVPRKEKRLEVIKSYQKFDKS